LISSCIFSRRLIRASAGARAESYCAITAVRRRRVSTRGFGVLLHFGAQASVVQVFGHAVGQVSHPFKQCLYFCGAPP